MAGHSKWANIRFRKGAQDVKRGKIFTKLIREITVATRLGGPLPETNPRLRDAITRAIKSNMKRDTIENAIKRGSGQIDGEQYQEIKYEGFGPGGVAVLIESLTDNRNRTVSLIRHAFTKFNGSLGTDGSVSYIFEKMGQIILEPIADIDCLLEIVTVNGGEDVNTLTDGKLELLISPENYHNLLLTLQNEGYDPKSSEITMFVKQYKEVRGDEAEQLIKFLDTLEDMDDVQNVYSNAEFVDTTH